MKYNLENLHWQQFEVFAFKCIKEIVSPSVIFIDGGSDKGRDIIYEGKSVKYKSDWANKWIFQVKHKNTSGRGEIKAWDAIYQDIKIELKKVFITNKGEYENYVLITNLRLTGDSYDKSHKVFQDYKNQNGIKCDNFEIISYHDLEVCIDDLDNLKWIFPSIVSNADFKLLIQTQSNFVSETRNKGWITSILRNSDRFVYTQFYAEALLKLEEYNIIILSGPPKSGKTFNAEILALSSRINQGFDLIRIDDPEEVEKFYNENIGQFFVCDDAFGKHELSYHSEDWYKKIENIFYLADDKHKFVFTSREYVYRAFHNFADHFAKENLEKILVESHNYSLGEKGSLLQTYTLLSKIDQQEKLEILKNESTIISHKNFSPETIRAFFSNLGIRSDSSKSPYSLLVDHINEPDEYLSNVFFNLKDEKKAVLISILCALDNTFLEVSKTYKNVCSDLNINKLLSYEREFDELDDSILKIIKSSTIEEINFYHPSMQKFLMLLVLNEEIGSIRSLALRNVNLSFLDIGFIKSSNFKKKVTKSSIVRKSRLKVVNSLEILESDLDDLGKGLMRLTENKSIKLYHIVWLLKWFSDPKHILYLKLNDREMYNKCKIIVQGIITNISHDIFFDTHKEESCSRWSELFKKIKELDLSYNFRKEENEEIYLSKLVEYKKSDSDFWKILLQIIEFSKPEFIHRIIGKDVLNNFATEMKTEIISLGKEIFGNEFPNIKKGGLGKMINKPNSKWFPRFILCNEKYKNLKSLKGNEIGIRLLNYISIPFEEILRHSDFAARRHSFNVSNGWWSKK